MLNRVMLIGRLGGDPEVRSTSNGTQVTNFTLATSEKWSGPDGNKQERTEWHRIVVFGKLAEVCGKYLNKGKLIYVGGRIQTKQWEDKEGKKRYTTEIIAYEMQMLGGGPAQEKADSIFEPQPPVPPDNIGADDDIPF
jgi:single-strand DNA-binding protein